VLRENALLADAAWQGMLPPSSHQTATRPAAKEWLPEQRLQQRAHSSTQRVHVRQRLSIAMGTLLYELPHLTTQTLQLIKHGHHLTKAGPCSGGARHPEA